MKLLFDVRLQIYRKVDSAQHCHIQIHQRGSILSCDGSVNHRDSKVDATLDREGFPEYPSRGCILHALSLPWPFNAFRPSQTLTFDSSDRINRSKAIPRSLSSRGLQTPMSTNISDCESPCLERRVLSALQSQCEAY